jgi:hypothetical protein
MVLGPIAADVLKWGSIALLFGGAREGAELLHDVLIGKSSAERAIRQAQRLQAKNEAIARAHLAAKEEREEETEERMAQYRMGPLMAGQLYGPSPDRPRTLTGQDQAAILSQATVLPTSMLGFMFPSAEELDGIRAQQALGSVEAPINPADLDFTGLED